ncbi:MAG: T9SS type A sorting domain-containing protein, partial [Candidatus Krumholzibacteria bacterium]|nr:T9SS type A sorting domain-containing protein [Candidatus Krumholzibacteria bacterium]
IDDDGYQEIVFQSSSGRVYGLNHDGTSMSGWPKWVSSNKFFVGSPALADLTKDGKLEVVIPGMNGYCYIFRYDGSSLPNWPQPYAPFLATESSPIIVDIDEDGNLDIILATENGYLNAWNVNGDYVAGFPMQIGTYLRGTPVVSDLDSDGDIELITSCWDKNIYVWDFDANEYSEYAAWNGFHANNYNTGWVEFEIVTAIEGLTCTYRFSGGMVELKWVAVPEFSSWKLFRREGDGEYELIEADLKADQGSTIQYTDRTIEEGVTYSYRLEADGRPELFIETDGIEVPVTNARLYQNYPNPFNPLTTIPFTVPGGSSVKRNVMVVIYDVRGAHVRTLVKGAMPGGRHTAQWDGRNTNGEPVSSGIYFVRFNMGGFKSIRKMVLLR